MYKRTKITPLQIRFLRENGIRQMWGADYNGEIVQMDSDVLVCIGGQGRMDDSFKTYSEIELFWGGLIKGTPFEVSSFYVERKIYDNDYILYVKIDRVHLKGNVDKSYFLRRFREMIMVYETDEPKKIIKDCQIINKPKFE